MSKIIDEQFQYFEDLPYFLENNYTFDFEKVDMNAKNEQGNTVLHLIQRNLHQVDLKKMIPILEILLKKDFYLFAVNNNQKNCFQVKKEIHLIDVLEEFPLKNEHEFNSQIKSVMLLSSKRSFPNNFLVNIDTFTLIRHGYSLDKERIRVMENSLYHDFNFSLNKNYRLPRHSKFLLPASFKEVSEKQQKDFLALTMMIYFIRIYQNKQQELNNFQKNKEKIKDFFENYSIEYEKIPHEYMGKIFVFTTLLHDKRLAKINKKIAGCFYMNDKKIENKEIMQLGMEEIANYEYQKIHSNLDKKEEKIKNKIKI